MSQTADNNLLYGLLALQLEFIDNEQMSAALRSCCETSGGENVQPIERDLGEALLESGVVTPEEHKAIEALRSFHLNRHQGRADLSVKEIQSTQANNDDATVGQFDASDTDNPQALQPDRDDKGGEHPSQSFNDEASMIEETLSQRESLIDMTQQDSSGVDSNGSLAQPDSGEHRFIVLREHAKGGLGLVSVARDTELNREVALKEIQLKFAGDKSCRNQFLLEAEITGSLEHPGVVPVYGLGADHQGRPYYAMRFIKGLSLKDAADQFHAADEQPRDSSERAIELLKLLHHFVDICNVVEYAFSRRILHRDIKPANVMLGKYGETLVVDWGLALRLDENGYAVCNQSVGTPAYMSPEQATGNGVILSLPSDIYSLGATLYYILTGQSPLTDRYLAEAMEKLKSGNITRPREVKPRVSARLEAICLKAMALLPEERYSSAIALADDIERWIADEPISAYREPWHGRLRRWARHHRTIVATAAVLLVTATVASAIGMIVVKQEQVRTETQREQAVAARLLADINADDARQAQDRAEDEADRADRQSRLALAALKAMVFDLQTKLKDVPAAHRVRKDLLNAAIDHLKEVVSSLPTNQTANHSLVWAHLDLGDIFLKAGAADEGDWTAEALNLYQRGYDIAAQIERENPGDSEAQQDLARSLDKLGDVRMAMGELTLAGNSYERAQRINAKRVENDLEDQEAKRDLAVSLNNLGDVELRAGDILAARNYYEKSLALAIEIAEALPNDHVAKRNLAVSYDRLGAVQMNLGEWNKARATYLKCLEMNRERAEHDPENTKVRIDLAVAHHHVGDVELHLDQGEPALVSYQASLNICDKLFKDDPLNIEVQRTLSVSHDRVGKAQMYLGAMKKAQESFERSLKINQNIATSDSSNMVAQRDLSISHEKSGDLQLQLEEYEAALTHYERSLEIATLIADADNSERSILELALAHAKMAEVLEMLEKFDEARAEHREAIASVSKLAEMHPGELSHQLTLAEYRSQLGLMEFRQMRFSDASEAFAEVILGLEPFEKEDSWNSQTQSQHWLFQQRTMAKFSQQAARAIEDVHYAETLSDAEASQLLKLRLRAFELRKDHKEIAATAKRLAKTSTAANGHQYFAAKGFANALGLIEGKTSPEEQDTAKLYREQVIQLLEDLQINGFFDNPEEADRLLSEPAFEVMADDPEFQAFIDSLEVQTSLPQTGEIPA